MLEVVRNWRYLCAIFGSLCVLQVSGAIIGKNSNDNSIEKLELGKSNVENTDFMNKMSWECANNASCLYTVANSLLQSYKRGETIKFGWFDITKVDHKGKPLFNTSESGRSISKVIDFFNGNAIRIPIGPMVFSVQRAEDSPDYIEVALLKRSLVEGRLGGGGGGGGMGGNGGGLGGILGGGMGGGMGGGGMGGGDGILGKRRQKHQDKKQMQMLIPMYLAASTLGWTLVAAKAVALLTLKALAISKIAFIVAVIAVFKKFMEHHHESKMMYQFPEHTPYMMPYPMDYPMHGAEIGTNEMYPAALQMAAMAPLSPQNHPGFESYAAAESHVHHNFADIQNNTQQISTFNTPSLGQKVKREDAWIAKAASGRRPFAYNYMNGQNPFYRA